MYISVPITNTMSFLNIDFTLFDIIPQPCIILDSQQKILAVNKRLLHLTKRSAEHFIHQPAWAFFPDLSRCLEHPREQQMLLFTLSRAQNSMIAAQYEKDLVGGILYLFPDQKHKFFTPHVLLKNRLLSNRLQFFQNFLNTSSDAIALYNTQGGLVYVNQTGAQWLGIRTTQIKKYAIWQTESFLTDEAHWHELRPELIKKKKWEYQREIQLKHEETPRYVSVKMTYKIIDGVPYFLSTAFDVTEKMMHKRALEEKEQQLEILRKNLPAAIFQLVITDELKTYFTYVNNRFEELFGFQLALNDVNWTFQARIHPEDQVLFERTVASSFLQGTEFSFIGRVCIQEQIKWIEVHSLPNRHQNTITYNGIIKDITERKEAEIAVQKRRLFNDRILDNIPADIAVFDKDHRYLYLNATTVQDDRTRSWLIGKTDFDYCALKNTSTEMAEMRRAYFLQAQRTQQSVDWLDTYERQGKQTHVLRRFFPFCIDGSFEFMIGYGMDVTELKEAESAIYRSQQRYELILNSALDAIIMLRADGTITFWNPVAACIFGWSSEEALHRSVTDLIVPAKFKKAMHRAFKEFIITQQSPMFNRLMELYAVNKSGVEFPIELTVLPVQETDELVSFCVFIRDISLRKQKEREIEEKNKKLRLQNRQLEQFTYIASHDLQEPLLTLMSFSELLKNEHYQHLDHEGKLFVDFIYKSAVRMRSLVTGLMEYARLGKIEQVEPIQVSDLVDDLLKDLQVSIQQKSAQITVGNLPQIMGHPTYIRLLLQNLISNSLKFAQAEVPPHIEIQSHQTDQHWQFSVQDNGIGIDPKDHDQIFTIFKKLHPHEKTDGFGFGLSHCKKIAQMHGGDLWVESGPGQGSTFTFSIAKNL